MIFDNLTIGAMIWGAIIIVIIAKLGFSDCRVRKILGKPCKKTS